MSRPERQRVEGFALAFAETKLDGWNSAASTPQRKDAPIQVALRFAFESVRFQLDSTKSNGARFLSRQPGCGHDGSTAPRCTTTTRAGHGTALSPETCVCGAEGDAADGFVQPKTHARTPKEVVGGFAILRANSKAEAIQLAKDFLQAVGDGECELRQIFEADTYAQEAAT
jgi:hypothetical protein